jgi:hypothetical protein
MRNAYKILVGKPKGSDGLRDLEIEGKTVLIGTLGTSELVQLETSGRVT